MKKTTRIKKADGKKKRVSTAVKSPAVKAGLKSAEKTARRDYIQIFNSHGKEIEKFNLDKSIFNGEVNKAVLYDAVRMYNANRRQGNASTKTRGDISGGGKKPWRQKGTGRARAGSTRSPLWRHGGVVFGPHPRDFHYDIPKKMKRSAFISSINAKLNENKVVGIDVINITEPKTKNFAAIVHALRLKGKSLFVLDKIDENIRRSSRNLKDVSLRNYKDFSTMDVLNNDNLVISKLSLEKLPERV
jgi:large subunit ribosomal protein L4